MGVARGAHALALVGVGSVEAVGFGGACGAAVGCAAFGHSEQRQMGSLARMRRRCAGGSLGSCRAVSTRSRFTRTAQRDPPSGLGLATLTIRVPHEGEHVTHHAAGSPSWMVGTAVRHSGDSGADEVAPCDVGLGVGDEGSGPPIRHAGLGGVLCRSSLGGRGRTRCGCQGCRPWWMGRWVIRTPGSIRLRRGRGLSPAVPRRLVRGRGGCTRR